ncbi:MAG: hypothetical protein LW832_10070 [Parachlamydia sp.]|jgi:hypothetical protein|nr:hypothetical protein [Parachlamydia sp.]
MQPIWEALPQQPKIAKPALSIQLARALDRAAINLYLNASSSWRGRVVARMLYSGKHLERVPKP